MVDNYQSYMEYALFNKNLTSEDAEYVIKNVVKRKEDFDTEKLKLISEGHSETETLRSIYTNRMENRFIPKKYLPSFVDAAIEYWMGNKSDLNFSKINSEIVNKLSKTENVGISFAKSLADNLFENYHNSIILDSINGEFSELEVLVNGEFDEYSYDYPEGENNFHSFIRKCDLKSIYSNYFSDKRPVNHPEFGYDKLFVLTSSKNCFLDSLNSLNNKDYSSFRKNPIIRTINKIQSDVPNLFGSVLLTRMKSGGRAADKILNDASHHDIFGVKLLVEDTSYFFPDFSEDLFDNDELKNNIRFKLESYLKISSSEEVTSFLKSALNIYDTETHRLPIPATLDNSNDIFSIDNPYFSLLIRAYEVIDFLDNSDKYNYRVLNRFTRKEYPSVVFKIDDVDNDESLELLLELNKTEDKLSHDNYVTRRDQVTKYLKKVIPELGSLSEFIDNKLYPSLDLVNLQKYSDIDEN
ncbi:hypothetical protein HOD61_01080 [archaeon]|jgi:hypothetical protein|nr:hypothetical protein [archaeon]